MKESIEIKGSDAYIAKKVPDYYGCDHKYYHTNLSQTESIEMILDRFLTIGEGRIDLSRNIVTAARKVPDELRVGKKLFCELVEKIGPPIDRTTIKSIMKGSGYLKQKEVCNVIKKGIKHSNVLSNKLIEFIIAGTASNNHDAFNKLALRAYIITEMTKIFENDAKFLSRI